jgi:hypothetical protein
MAVWLVLALAALGTPAAVAAGEGGAAGSGGAAPEEGKVVIFASADMIKNDFLSEGGDFASAERLFLNLLDEICLDRRLLELKRAPASLERQAALPKPLEEVLSGLSRPLAIRYYSSQKGGEPMLRLKAATIDLLKRMEGSSGGKLKWEEIDPEEKARGYGGERAQEYLGEIEKRGILPIQLGSGAGASTKIYSAIELEEKDRPPEVVPAHQRLQGLEYQLARRILRIEGTEDPRVVFFDGKRPRAGGPGSEPGRHHASQYSAVLKELEAHFEVEQIALKEKDSLDDVRRRMEESRKKGEGEPESRAPDSPPRAPRISCLVVAEPHDLEERQVYEISRAVAGGTPAVFLVSGFSLDVSDEGFKAGFPVETLRPGLEGLFLTWGVGLGEDLLASRDCGSLPIPQRIPNRQAVIRMPHAFPVLVRASGDALERRHPLLASTQVLVFPAAVALSVDQEAARRAGLRVTELARSGKEAYTVRFSSLKSEKTKREEPRAVMRQKELMDPKERKEGFLEPRPLALLLEGKFPFKQGQPAPEWRKEEK